MIRERIVFVCWVLLGLVVGSTGARAWGVGERQERPNMLLVRWPGKVGAGTDSAHLVAFWDFLPTLAEIAGGTFRGAVDGISFYPTLIGDVSKQRAHPYLYWEFLEWDFAQAVRLQDWKAVRTSAAEPLELYDLEADPSETTDVAGENAEIVDVMRHIMETARSESPHWPTEVIEEIAARRR